MKCKGLYVFFSAIILGIFISCFSTGNPYSAPAPKKSMAPAPQKSIYECIYILSLAEVEHPANAQERYGESSIISFEEEGSKKYSYEDDLIKIIWLPLEEELSFVLENKTNHSIKIIWDEAVFIDENNLSGKVMHSGVKYTDRNNSQPPTVVGRNARITDVVVPTDHIWYSEYSGWHTTALIDNLAHSKKEELDIEATEKIGKTTVGVLLPLQIEETINEYIFSFKVDGYIYKD
jgi:hypothetical protein